MKTITVKIYATSIFSQGHTNNKVELEIDGVDKDSLMEHLSIDDILSFYNEADILNTIGKEQCANHFDLNF